MKLRSALIGGCHGGIKRLKRGDEEEKREPKGMFVVETSREVGSGYSVNDLLKDGSRRRGPLR